MNCPCQVHTEERGYEWIVFRRQPDREMNSSEDDTGQDYTLEEISDDDVFFSAEAEEALLGPITDKQSNAPESERILEKKDSSTDGSDGNKEMAKPQMSNLPHDSSLHSRDENSTISHQTDQKKKRKNKRKKNKVEETDESPMSLDEMNKPEEKEIPKKRKGFSYYPLLTYKRYLGKTFYYKYFRPYSLDYRRLTMEEDCQCPQTEPHDTKCEWYDPEIIYILETQGDISAREEDVQQKIYDIYMSSLNSSHKPTEYCGCGTAAEIAYMGHHTGCN